MAVFYRESENRAYLELVAELAILDLRMIQP